MAILLTLRVFARNLEPSTSSQTSHDKCFNFFFTDFSETYLLCKNTIKCTVIIIILKLQTGNESRFKIEKKNKNKQKITNNFEILSNFILSVHILLMLTVDI